ncbi:MAG: undecaprenyl-diphosphate phosphatase, partial [bacterium]
ESARFSFLLAVPLILGVSLIKFFELLASPPSSELLVMLVIGFLTAYLSGLIAIKWLLGIIQQGRFDRFAYYCFGVGILGLIFSNI